jgi:hypothetical protein
MNKWTFYYQTTNKGQTNVLKDQTNPNILNETRIVPCIFHILQRAKFSISLMNFPFLEILFRTSQKIKQRICSSVFGYPRTLISFLTCHMWYNVELSINLHNTPSNFLVFHFLQASSSTPCQSKRGCCMKQRFMQVFQIRELKLQEKNR